MADRSGLSDGRHAPQKVKNLGRGSGTPGGNLSGVRKLDPMPFISLAALQFKLLSVQESESESYLPPCHSN